MTTRPFSLAFSEGELVALEVILTDWRDTVDPAKMVQMWSPDARNAYQRLKGLRGISEQIELGA